MDSHKRIRLAEFKIKRQSTGDPEVGVPIKVLSRVHDLDHFGPSLYLVTITLDGQCVDLVYNSESRKGYVKRRDWTYLEDGSIRDDRGRKVGKVLERTFS